MNKSETITELAKALSKFQAEVEGAKRSSQVKYKDIDRKYADLESVWDAIRKPLTDNGLSVTQLSFTTDPGLVGLTTMVMHTSGEWISGEIVMPLAKMDPQAVGSCITYARRYALTAALGIYQEDDDEEANARRLNNLWRAISNVVTDLKKMKYDRWHEEPRRIESYKYHLGVAKPIDCGDIGKLRLYHAHLIDVRDEATAQAAQKPAAKRTESEPETQAEVESV